MVFFFLIISLLIIGEVYSFQIENGRILQKSIRQPVRLYALTFQQNRGDDNNNDDDSLKNNKFDLGKLMFKPFAEINNIVDQKNILESCTEAILNMDVQARLMVENGAQQIAETWNQQLVTQSTTVCKHFQDWIVPMQGFHQKHVADKLQPPQLPQELNRHVETFKSRRKAAVTTMKNDKKSRFRQAFRALRITIFVQTVKLLAKYRLLRSVMECLPHRMLHDFLTLSSTADCRPEILRHLAKVELDRLYKQKILKKNVKMGIFRKRQRPSLSLLLGGSSPTKMLQPKLLKAGPVPIRKINALTKVQYNTQHPPVKKDPLNSFIELMLKTDAQARSFVYSSINQVQNEWNKHLVKYAASLTPEDRIWLEPMQNLQKDVIAPIERVHDDFIQGLPLQTLKDETSKQWTNFRREADMFLHRRQVALQSFEKDQKSHIRKAVRFLRIQILRKITKFLLRINMLQVVMDSLPCRLRQDFINLAVSYDSLPKMFYGIASIKTDKFLKRILVKRVRQKRSQIINSPVSLSLKLPNTLGTNGSVLQKSLTITGKALETLASSAASATTSQLQLRTNFVTNQIRSASRKALKPFVQEPVKNPRSS